MPNSYKNNALGARFGKLVVIRVLDERRHGHVMVECVCDCGNHKNIMLSSLIKGMTQSCGCYRKEYVSNKNRTHNKSKTRLYSIWCDMKRRCYNQTNKRYENYGGRGIKVCDEWRNNFQSFYEWAMANGYSDDLTIDRINVNGNYAPENCKWSTSIEQQNNTTRNHFLTYNGKTMTLAEWERETGIHRDILKDRINKLHWTTERALTTPVRRIRREFHDS